MAQAHLELQQSFETLETEKAQMLQEKVQLEQALEALKQENDKIQKEMEALKEPVANQKTETLKVSQNKTAYLTFDDGPSSNTIKILDILKKYEIKATFFVIGSETESSKKIYRRIVEEGHVIGNHTYSHNYNKIYASVENFMEDIWKLEALLEEVAGVKPKIIRFPGGSKNQASSRAGGKGLMADLITRLQEEGYQYFDWNVTSKDASAVTPDKEIIVRSVLEGIQGKKEAIILFHDNAPKTTTVEALPEIIEALLEKGYKFEVLSETSYYVHHR
ncbi:Peptidoglycan/xylan/chitin deacetylase, PgdA/CDA1 family [Geosporobacter subterraneus DSM 17957]|uniref:Peptidoglycan/xylan/chitin deacetylase, PgdA/CDA1 family n=1 Tax=Geosporobacter subterraneus DSM 17957 TaxID=1121919 RepID=A0A1M6D4T4_9FIRM|nr:polysaccharide deacetylase family protein [Geosporobacter subterraneus]SHI68285.1 Peptidoglycan/xylan/chitin deacetylase, PgdA/CDA1 family [Geosporobacter subterraneus DSM 17957]